MGSEDLWFFERVARLYDLAMPSADVATLAAALRRAEGPVDRVLDVAGGTGRASRVIGIGNRTVIDAARGMLARVPAPIGAVQGDATRLPVRAGSADAVLIVDALHHLPAHDRVLGEARRALRPGGVLVLVEFDPGTVRGRLVGVAERFMGFDSDFRRPGTLRRLVAAAGFEAEITDRGFTYTVIGRKPSDP